MFEPQRDKQDAAGAQRIDCVDPVIEAEGLSSAPRNRSGFGEAPGKSNDYDTSADYGRQLQ
jgi:hypothetical protein